MNKDWNRQAIDVSLPGRALNGLLSRQGYSARLGKPKRKWGTRIGGSMLVNGFAADAVVSLSGRRAARELEARESRDSLRSSECGQGKS